MAVRCQTKAVLSVDEKLQGTIIGGKDIVEREIVLYPEDRPLHPVEIAFLLYRGCADVFQDEKQLDFEKFLTLYSRRNPHAVALLEVYTDLRSRGRLPIPGPRENSLLLLRSRRNPKAIYYVLVLEESSRVSLTELTSFVEEARHNNLTPVIAIVDRYGDITYYTPMVFHPRGKPETLG